MGALGGQPPRATRQSRLRVVYAPSSRERGPEARRCPSPARRGAEGEGSFQLLAPELLRAGLRSRRILFFSFFVCPFPSVFWGNSWGLRPSAYPGSAQYTLFLTCVNILAILSFGRRRKSLPRKTLCLLTFVCETQREICFRSRFDAVNPYAQTSWRKPACDTGLKRAKGRRLNNQRPTTRTMTESQSP